MLSNYNIVNNYKVKSPALEEEKRKKKGLVARFIGEQGKWKRFIDQKQEEIARAKAKIKNHEVKLASLIAIFVISMAFSLVTLVVLTPLAILGLAIKVPYLLWSMGIGGVIFGVTTGSAAIRSASYLNRKKEELEKIRKERRQFKFLVKHKDVLRIFMNYDELKQLGFIDLTKEEHQTILKKDYWKQAEMIQLVEEMEIGLEYVKNLVKFPEDLEKSIKAKFTHLLRT